MASWRVLAYSGLPATPSVAAHHQMESFAGRAGLGLERADQSTMMWVSKIIQEQGDSSGLFGRATAGCADAQAEAADDIVSDIRIVSFNVKRYVDPFEQSFFLLVHIPYLQAFNDVNKRTSRIAANIPLLKADLAPLSFLTMDDASYIDGLIGVYEINNVSLLREIYVDAYLASAENYTVLRAELESPSKAALVYRDFVRLAVRRNVLEWKEFRRGDTALMAAEARTRRRPGAGNRLHR